MTLGTPRYDGRTVHEFVSLFKEGKLNLNPGFQRDSVWTGADRRRLMESILQGYPIPSVFLYRRQDDRGKIVYDVIDGKQRLESILMFQGVGKFRGQRFTVKAQLDGTSGIEEWDWRKIERKRHQLVIDGHEIQTVEVSGDLADIIDLFVRINSTGKRLTGAERRHAKFYRTEFLRNARRVASRYEDYLRKHRILSAGQISRMKHVELVSELMASLNAGGLINKKKALDDAIGGKSIDGRSLPKIVNATTRTLNLAPRMFPHLRETRFANSADFYSLFMLIWSFDRQGLILSDKARNRQAEKLLIWLSNGVSEVRERVRKAEGARANQRLFRDYLLTIQGDTDSQANRKRREEILERVFGGLFEQRDKRRGFTVEQRRLIWHSDEQKRCSNCKQVLTWDNFTIDHVKPYSRGGRSSRENAALMCRPCNSSKGARRRARVRARRGRSN